MQRHAKCYGFSLIELLVVIAIISVLAAMMLPSLAEALEMSRRMTCANNQRNLVLAQNHYANDSDDRLPYLTCSNYFDLGELGRIYGEADNSPSRRFFSMYADVDATVTGMALFNKNANIAYCPSTRLVPPASDFDWKHQGSYAFRGFGTASGGRHFGTTRLSAIALPGPGGFPKAILMDVVEFPVSPIGYCAKNHESAGGNIAKGDGSVAWVGIDRMYKQRYSNAALPYGYYVQSACNIQNNPSGTWFGMCPIDYPTGVDAGWGHQPTLWPKHRQWFGYSG